MKQNFRPQILLAWFVICGMPFSAIAQKVESASLKIKGNKPSVYITFDRIGKQNPLFEGENNERVWLKLHNNTKLKIFLCTFAVDKEYGQHGIFYQVERFSFFKEYKNTKIPQGYGQIDDCEVFTLFPEKNLLFSTPREHLAKGLSIKTRFYYGWTGNWKEDMYEGTTNFVSFGNNQLPVN